MCEIGKPEVERRGQVRSWGPSEEYTARLESLEMKCWSEGETNELYIVSLTVGCQAGQ